MNIQRSPPESKLTTGSDQSGSDLTSTYYDNEDSTPPYYVNLRKRKERPEESDYNQSLERFRNDIMKFMEDFGKQQNENLKQIRDEISEIKNEIKTIKLNSEHFTEKIDLINTEIENIKIDNNITQQNFKRLEEEINQIKNNQPTDTQTIKSPVAHNEDIIQELKDRCEREKNVIIVGISETINANSNARQKYDYEEVTKLITTFTADIPNPIKCMRLGKYVPNKCRPIKVCFANTDAPKYLLRNKNKLPENIQIYSDQTPTQKKILQSIKEELNTRIESGEKDLTLKYIKGIPTIVINKNNQKN